MTAITAMLPVAITEISTVLNASCRSVVKVVTSDEMVVIEVVGIVTLLGFMDTSVFDELGVLEVVAETRVGTADLAVLEVVAGTRVDTVVLALLFVP